MIYRTVMFQHLIYQKERTSIIMVRSCVYGDTEFYYRIRSNTSKYVSVSGFVNGASFNLLFSRVFIFIKPNKTIKGKPEQQVLCRD